MRNLLQAIQRSDVFQCVYRRGKSSVEAENLKQERENKQRSLRCANAATSATLHLYRQPHLVIHQRGEGQIVKQICEVLPNVGISIFPEALVVEAIHLRNLSALVVSSENCDSFTKPYLQRKSIKKQRIISGENHPFPSSTSFSQLWSAFFFFYLKRNQESNCLHRIVTSVNIVSHEEVVGVWRLAPDLKQLHQVMELTVDISTHRHWTSHLLHIGLLCQDLLCL